MLWTVHLFCMDVIQCTGCSLSKDIFSFRANIGQSVPLCPHSAESSCAWSRVAPTSRHWDSYNPGIHESLMSSLDHAPRVVCRMCLPSNYSWLIQDLCSLVLLNSCHWLHWYLFKITIYGERPGVCKMRSCLFKAPDRTAWFCATQFEENFLL